MSQTRDEELGRRRFQLVKEQAVEDAVEKIRRAQAVDWPSLCAADCILLREILGDLWICLERKKWEQYSILHAHEAGYQRSPYTRCRTAGPHSFLFNDRKDGGNPLSFTEYLPLFITGSGKSGWNAASMGYVRNTLIYQYSVRFYHWEVSTWLVGKSRLELPSHLPVVP